jgi:phosphatidate cytidylyltransferase
MLIYRILTAIVLIPIFVLCVLKLSAPNFCYLTGLITLWAAWEWSALMGIKTFLHRLIYPVFVFFILCLTLFCFLITHVLYVSFFTWLIATILVITYPRTSSLWGKSLWVRGLMGIMVLMPAWLAANFIRTAENGPYILLFLFILIWGADSGAYFIGKKWGKHLLHSTVSPKKTWEGLIGGLATTLVISLLALYYADTPFKIWPAALLLAFITILFSVIGDLFESMLKRIEGLKDSGSLLPGHGGLLDRIDSFTAAAPIFALGAMILGKIYLSGN